jgi:hypothetical protein
MSEQTEPQTPPLDGPTANETDLDHALFGPYDDND